MPPSQWLTYKSSQFIGENRTRSLEALAPNQVNLALNMVTNAYGQFETRLGKTALNTTLGAGPIRGIWRYSKENGTKYLVVFHGTTLYAGTWAGGTASVTLASIKTGLDATARLRGLVWRDNLILTNGVQNPFRYNGTTCTDLAGSPPKAQYLKVFAGKLFFNDVANPSYIRFSGLEDYDTWDALDVIKVRDNDGDKISGFATMMGGMVIFKARSAWSLVGQSRQDFVLLNFSDNLGCDAPDSISDDGYMISQDNIYKFTLDTINPLSFTHDSVIRPLTSTQKAAIVATDNVFDKRYVVSLSAYKQLVIDKRSEGVTSWTNLNVNALASADDAGDDGAVLVGDATNGIVYALNNATDDAGTAITSLIVFPDYDFGSTRKKQWRVFWPEMTILKPRNADGTATVGVSYIIDQNDTQADTFSKSFADATEWDIDNWDAQTWGPTNYVDTGIWQIHAGRGNRISFRVTSSSRFKLDNVKVKYRETGDYI